MGRFFLHCDKVRVNLHEKTPQASIAQKSKKQLKQLSKRKEKRLKELAQKAKQTDLVYQIHQTIVHHFPELFRWMREIDDCRKKESTYDLAELLTACLAMHLFKAESRNGFNNLREDLRFAKNYKRLFKMRMPHMDAVDNVIRLLKTEQLERLKQQMVKVLIRRKVFHKQRYRRQWYCVAIDATGVASYQKQHCEQCLHKTSKKGRTTWFHNVLEARLVTPNGFSISLLSEWIENPTDEDYDKQDCERKAFTRLAARLKQDFPRLPILILADGLYPYEGFFALCKKNHWPYIVTFKEGNLPTIWEETRELQIYQKNNEYREFITKPDGNTEEQQYRWVTKMDYHGHTLNWLECKETTTHRNQKKALEETQCTFNHINDLPLQNGNIVLTSRTGRLRWKIENEGFNTLKNEGYGLKHKYSRVSYQASKNYYQLMQMAHLINQLMILSVHFQSTYLKGKNHPTLKNLWQDLIAAMKWAELDVKKLQCIKAQKIQIRFVT